jgi:hypothetical protein
MRSPVASGAGRAGRVTELASCRRESLPAGRAPVPPGEPLTAGPRPEPVGSPAPSVPELTADRRRLAGGGAAMRSDRRSTAPVDSRHRRVRACGGTASDPGRIRGIARCGSKRPGRDRRGRTAGGAAGQRPAIASVRHERRSAPAGTRGRPWRAGRLARPNRPGTRADGHAAARANDASTEPATSRSADPRGSIPDRLVRPHRRGFALA